MPHGPPPTTSVTADKGNKKLFVWLSLTFVGMLAVAALVFVLMYENKNDKAESLLAEAKAHISSNNLDAAALCLRQAGIYSPEAKSLLAEVQGLQDKEREQFRERERVIKANERITALLESARESLSNNAISDANKKAHEALKIADSLAKGRLEQIDEFFGKIDQAVRERRGKEVAIQRAEKLATRVKEANADVKRLIKKGRRQLQSLKLELAVGTAKKALLIKDATNHALAHALVSDAEEALTEFKRPPKDVDEFMEKCVVKILFRKNHPKVEIKGLGSGFFIGPDLLATNYHVVDSTYDVVIKFRDGHTLTPSGIVHFDESADIAIVEVPNSANRSKRAKLATEVKQGDPIRALGHPQDLDWSITSGVVSAFRNDNGGPWIQTDTFIDSGNSGGPVINSANEVVGIATGKDLEGVKGVNVITHVDNLAKVFLEANEKLRKGIAVTAFTDSSPYVEYYANGQRKTVGHLRRNQKEGLWTEWRENGHKEWEAHFKNGTPDGLSTSWYENGQMRFKGDFENGKQQGLFTGWHENGQKKREENYKDGKLNGKTTIWRQDGSLMAEGQYENGKYHGSVILYDKNGNHYETQWYDEGEQTGYRNIQEEEKEAAREFRAFREAQRRYQLEMRRRMEWHYRQQERDWEY